VSAAVLSILVINGSVRSGNDTAMASALVADELRKDPVVTVEVAAGAIGPIKSLEHLRGVCAHVGAHALPLPVSVANVQRVFDRCSRRSFGIEA
jgi:NAD(P)H-dependent FMN reductase